MSPLALTPIGHLETPWPTPADCPRNGRQPDPRPLCRAVVLPEYRAGLDRLDSFSHLILLYWMHLSGPAPLVVTPRFAAGPRGVFATRAPVRPNPIALSVVAFDGLRRAGRAAGPQPRLRQRHAAAGHQALPADGRCRAGRDHGLAGAALSAGAATRPPCDRAASPVILVSPHAAIGFALATGFMAAVLLADPGGLGGLLRDPRGPLPLVLLWGFSGLTFGAVQFGFALWLDAEEGRRRCGAG